ncbi:hypothetical protein PV10_04085 [Exophiala mesophila]|uniref:Uncharacterized protein n=1 Tax=Exophiala mesophila TaxID=212818 RepID=A0A0D1ZG40_EXOME|nr:uncharacterized protein PV10_04085 [Exophiala mesophila]KIV92819.1 hypothetical protein PV10_04085 [Exophiala mesophila]
MGDSVEASVSTSPSLSPQSAPSSTVPTSQSTPQSISTAGSPFISVPDIHPGFQVSRVAILGAGPSGLAFAKVLLAEKTSFQNLVITIFEQRNQVGGIWNLSANVISKTVAVPQSDKNYGTGVDENQDKASHSLELESPLYDYLETNVPKQLMPYAGVPFPDEDPLFPSHGAVLKYLQGYANNVLGGDASATADLRFGVKIREVALLQGEGASGKDTWEIQSEHLASGNIKTETYDAVVVANGHYTVPYIPEIEGAAEWNRKYPGTILHSKAYRRPQDFAGKKVLVIGNSASGLDIAAQIGFMGQPKGKVLLSARSASAFGPMPAVDWKEDVDQVVEFLDSDRAVRFASGRVERDLDAVIFSTGYFFSYPFLTKVGSKIVDDGFRVKGLYEHLFLIDHPTLVFPVVNLKVIPFPLAENQAAVVARVWSGRLDLPSKDKMRQWEQQEIKANGDGKYFHQKMFPQDAAQINHLYRWACQARGSPSQDSRLTRWDEKLVWLRSRLPSIKMAFMTRGHDRVKVKTAEEMGFDFDEWRKTAAEGDLEMFHKGGCYS